MTRRQWLSRLAAALLLGISGCHSDTRPTFQNTDLSAGKLFPQANLLDSYGRPQNFADFRGKLLIVIFGYTRCPDICPGTLGKYADLLASLPAHESERLQLLFISVDPARDTAAHTDTYVKWFNPGFIGLSGDAQKIAEVARQFKVIYRKQAVKGGMGYVMDHSTAAYILDTHGQLRLSIAENARVEAIVADLRLLLAE